MKFLGPVLAGSRLDYRVRWTEVVGDSVRFETEAYVADALVASGTITGVRVTSPIFTFGR